LFRQRVVILGLGFLLGCFLAAPAVLLYGRIWAEEGLDFFAYAVAYRQILPQVLLPRVWVSLVFGLYQFLCCLMAFCCSSSSFT